MSTKTNAQMESSKQFSRYIIKSIILVALVVSTFGITSWRSELMTSKKQNSEKEGLVIKEFMIPVVAAELYCKIIGKGRPILFIHGGPGLVHNYFLPYMESLLPVSYTHLRAHETDSYLVCRLLL